MSGRRRAAGVAVAAAVLGLCGSATTDAATRTPVARPNPVLVGIHLDYVNPIPGPNGAPATLAPLDPAVIPQAVADQLYLAIQTADDLGGFAPVRVGRLASSNGRSLVGRPAGESEIPHFAAAAGGRVNSFAATGAESFTPPDQGQQPVPGLGTPPPVTPPSNSNTVPPANGDFGGKPKPPAGTTTTTPPATTTRPTPTTPTTTTAPPTTTTTPTPSPPTTPTTPTPPFVGASCGTAGLTITSDHSTCRIVAVNMAPGGSASEVMTVTNDTPEPFDLSLRADGTVNALWHALQMGVWETGTAAPTPFPALLFWTTQPNALGTLQPGESVRYQIELYLPTTASNALQGMTATIDLIWRAQA